MSQVNPNKELKLYNVLTGVFVASLLLVAPLGSKFLLIGPFVISAASLTFPINFIFNNLLTEVYGYKRSRRIIWTGMGCQIFAAFMFFIVKIWPSPDFWHNQEAYNLILGSTPRITFASIFAYFFSEYTKSSTLSIMKYKQKGKRGLHQALRFISSTVIGEAVDSVLFISVAFAGTLPAEKLFETIVGVWVFKVGFEFVALPITTRAANLIKKVENMDTIDEPGNTNYSPFSVTGAKTTVK